MRLLFVCTHGVARALMAEAFAWVHGCGQVEAWSAGVENTPIDPAVSLVMAETRLTQVRTIPKTVREIPRVHWDVVVQIGGDDKAYPVLPADRIIRWDLPDPTGRSIARYREVRGRIENEVTALLVELGVTSQPSRVARPWAKRAAPWSGASIVN